MNDLLVLHPLRPIRRSHVTLMRQVAAIQHGLLDQSTSLGYLWSLLHPLLMLAVLFAFFSRRVGADVPHYALYLLIGLVQFTHFSKSTASAMRVLYRMRNLVTNVIFPKDVLVYSALLADAPEFLISMAATVLIAIVTGVPITWALAALPVVLVLELLLVLWISLVLSIMYVYVRDLDHIYEVAMRVLFFVTPIIYSVDILSPTVRRVVLFNPLAHIIAYARMVILEGHLPPAAQLFGFIAVNLALVYLAMLLFRRVEASLVERL